MKIMVTSFKSSHAHVWHSLFPTLKQATAESSPCQRLLGSDRHVCVSNLGGHCSFLLIPGAQKILFVPLKSLFPQSCLSSGGSMVGLMVPSTRKFYAIPRSAAPRAPVAGHC